MIKEEKSYMGFPVNVYINAKNEWMFASDKIIDILYKQVKFPNLKALIALKNSEIYVNTIEIAKEKEDPVHPELTKDYVEVFYIDTLQLFLNDLYEETVNKVKDLAERLKKFLDRFRILKNYVKEAFSTMDVYLKKRYDLVPNLVNVVKGYATHEKDTLEAITNARSKAYDYMNTNEKN
jgi:hypothetical protein